MAIMNINLKWKNYIYQNLSIPQWQNEQGRIRNFCSNSPSTVKDKVSVLRDTPPSDFYKFLRPFYRLQASSIESRRKMCSVPKKIFFEQIWIQKFYIVTSWSLSIVCKRFCLIFSNFSGIGMVKTQDAAARRILLFPSSSNLMTLSLIPAGSKISLWSSRPLFKIVNLIKFYF